MKKDGQIGAKCHYNLSLLNTDMNCSNSAYPYILSTSQVCVTARMYDA